MNTHVRKFPENDLNAQINAWGAFSDGIDLNNEGIYLSEMNEFEKAVETFKKAIELKKKAYGEVSVEVCISLSGLADAYLSLKDYENSYKEASRMLSIAKEIGSQEQMRIAREILSDISQQSGKELKDDMKYKPPSSIPSIYTPKQGVGISIEPPARQCNNFKNMCSNKENLMLCARCMRVMYCSVECQKVTSLKFSF